MSYDHAFLFQRIFLHMVRQPCVSVQTISRELNVSRRTIQVVIQHGTGLSYSALRREILVARTLELFSGDPGLAIKQVSFTVGFASPRSFARAIKRATGLSPECFRFQVLEAQHAVAYDASASAEDAIRKYLHFRTAG